MTMVHDIPDLSGWVQAEKTHLTLPSKPHWIEPAADFLRQKAVLCGACQESRSRKLVVALHEALANAIIHGNLELSSDLKERDDDSFTQTLAQRSADPVLAARVVDVVVDFDGDGCHWILTDQGKGFDVERMLAPAQVEVPGEWLASGRGILMMRSFMDEVNYEAGGRRVILTMRRASGEEKRRRPRQPFQQRLHVAPIRHDGSVDWAAAYEAVACNLSTGGLALLQEKLISSQQILLGITAGEETFYLPAEVRHCRDLGGGLVELGCCFQTGGAASAGPAPAGAAPMAKVEAAIAALIEGRQPTAIDHERRRHTRVVFNERIEIIPAASAPPVVAYSRDLSKGGVSFITTTRLQGLVTIVIDPASPGGPLRLLSNIVRCNEIEKGYFDVAARFVGLQEKTT